MFETLASLAPQHEVVVFNRLDSPEEATKVASRRVAQYDFCDSEEHLRFVFVPVAVCWLTKKIQINRPYQNSGAANEHFGKSWADLRTKADPRHPARTPLLAVPPPSASPAAGSPSAAAPASVDVAPISTRRSPPKNEKLEWRTSIVDLMKALDIDSSLTARKELAKETKLHCDTNDSASMTSGYKTIMGNSSPRRKTASRYQALNCRRKYENPFH